jgi:hypothetical protein
MAQELINVGAAPNDGQGDPIREAFIKCNDNFTELFGGSGGSNAISNGNSVVQISTANGNISMSVSGTDNVAVVTTTGITVSNTLTAANIDAVNLAINNISSDDSTFITIEDGVIVNGVISAVGNITGGNVRAISNLIMGSGSNLQIGMDTANVHITNTTANGNISFLTNFNGNGTTFMIAKILGTGTQGILANGIVSASGNITANNFVGAGAGTTTLSATTNLDLSANTAVRVTGGATFRLPSLDASQIANIVAANGDMIYNTTVNKIQGYEGGAWGNLI